MAKIVNYYSRIGWTTLSYCIAFARLDLFFITSPLLQFEVNKTTGLPDYIFIYIHILYIIYTQLDTKTDHIALLACVRG